MSDTQSNTSTDPPPPGRRSFQFRLRTVLWVLLSCGLCLGWWCDRQRLMEQYRRAELLREAQRLAFDPQQLLDSFRSRMLSPGGVVVDGWVDPETENDATVEPLERYGLDSDTRLVLMGLAAPGGRLTGPSYEERIAELVEALSEPDAERRARAARTLALPAWRDAAAVPALSRALDDPQRVVRWHAALALGEFGPEAAAAAPRLRAMVQGHGGEDAELSAFAAQMLLRIDRRQNVVSPLVGLLGDEQTEPRRRAALALARSSHSVDTAGADRLLTLLTDGDAKVRQAACRAIGQVVPREAALDALLAAFQAEQDATTRALIARELSRLDAAEQQP